MGMEVTSGQIPAAQAVLETTAAVMRGEAGALDGSSLVVYGTVRQMDPYTRTFYEDVAGVSRFSAADQARFLPLVLVEGPGRALFPAAFAGGTCRRRRLRAGGGCVSGAGPAVPRPGAARRLSGRCRRGCRPAAGPGIVRFLPPDAAGGAPARQLPLAAV